MRLSPRIRAAVFAFLALLVVPIAAAAILLPQAPEVRSKGTTVAAPSRVVGAPSDGATETQTPVPSGAGYRILSVKVLDADGAPISGAKVWVDSVKGRSARTSAEGVALLQGITIKPVVVRASSTSHRSGRVDVAAGKTGETTSAELKLQAAQPISGRVLNADGYPAAGAIVRCLGVVEGEAVSSKTDEEGNFTLSPSAEGCDLVASMAGAGPSETQKATSGQELTLRLRKMGAIEGVVLSSDGVGVPRATVGVELYVPISEDFNSRLRKSTMTDGEGNFSLTDLPPGRYVLTATGRAAAPAKTDPIELGTGEVRRGVRMSFDGGAEVSGRITDAESGEPIAGVIVRLQGITISKQAPPRPVRTDDDGRFTLPGAPEDMPFSVRAQASGYNIRLVSGLTAGRSVDIALNPADGRPRKEVPTTGLTIRASGDALEVVHVDPNSTAFKAGLLKGDRILSIDGRSAENMTHVEAMQRLRGEPGTSVALEYSRGGDTKRVSVERELLLN